MSPSLLLLLVLLSCAYVMGSLAPRPWRRRPIHCGFFSGRNASVAHRVRELNLSCFQRISHWMRSHSSKKDSLIGVKMPILQFNSILKNIRRLCAVRRTSAVRAPVRPSLRPRPSGHSIGQAVCPIVSVSPSRSSGRRIGRLCLCRRRRSQIKMKQLCK